MENANVNENETTVKQTQPSVKAGYILIGLSLIIFPLFLGLAGFIVGIVNIAKNETGHGTAQVVLSIFCAIIGALIGMSI